MASRGVRPAVRDAAQPKQAGIAVWDRAVRWFHWLLVIGVATSLLTGYFGSATTRDAHVVFGTLIAVLVVFRCVWGFFGGRHARFADFVRMPGAILRYAIDLSTGSAPRHLGHNPLGGAMILALLAVLAALIATGVMALGGAFKDGPLAPFLTWTQGRAALGVHAPLSVLLMAMIAAHLLGVLAESLRTRENLVRAMITGRKAAREAAVGPASQPEFTARPRLAAAMLAGLTLVAAPTIAHLSMLPGRGVPAAPLDQTYAKECGACHAPHHPSLAPAATWSAIVAGLEDHFGDNAGLSPEVAAHINAYLLANHAGTSDTLASHRLAPPDTRAPLRITATRGWLQIHTMLDDTVFKSKSVGGKVNCVRCHRDAENGRFSPRAIAIPEERSE